MIAAEARPRAAVAADDTSIGLVMFFIFTAAILIVTGAVALLALVGSWWMLGAAFAVHVVMTATVTTTIAHSMSGGALAAGRATGDQARANPRLETRPPREAVAAQL